MRVDYHLHTSRCCHACGTPRQYLLEAEAKGLSEIGFADHFPLGLFGVTECEPVTMQPEELDDYIGDVAALQKTATIPVRLGVEVDYLPGKERETAKLLARYPFDYTIGSIHFLDGWDFTNPAQAGRYETENINSLYDNYYSLVQEMAQSGLFQIIGHLDVIKKFAFFPRSTCERMLAETCRILKKADVCVELNTSGWRAPVGEAYPGEALLSVCREFSIPVTLGSDAHRPGDVGGGLQRALLLLHKVGYQEIATFAGGERTMRPLQWECLL